MGRSRWDTRTVKLATPEGSGEHQALKLNLCLSWPKELGPQWDCDVCGVRFEDGDVQAEHKVYEDDWGQGWGNQERYWFSRIHSWHYEVERRA